MRFSPAVERATGGWGTWRARKGEWGGAAALKYCSVPLLPRLLRRFYGRVEQWRIPDVIVAASSEVWGKAQEREENIERNSTGRGGMRKGGGQTSRRVAGGRKGGMLKELVYDCTRRWRLLAADYMDHCARTTASAHAGEWNRIEQGKERNAVLLRGFLDRKGSKIRKKGVVIVRVIKTLEKIGYASRYESH